MKVNIKSKIFIILPVLALVVAGCSHQQLIDENLKPNIPANAVVERITPAQLQSNYEISITKILRPYWEENKIVGIKEKIIDLKAPVKYLDLHINLVIAFELLEQGRLLSDQAKIEDGLEKIFKLKSEYGWIESS